MTKRTVSRRTLLRGLGASLAAVPLLGRIPSAEAAAEKRFVVFYTPNEAIGKNFWAPGANMALTPMMKPLEPYKSKLVMLGGMEMASRLDDPWSGGHVGSGHVLVGRKVIPYGASEPDFYASGISVDQHIASALGVEPLVVGARSGINANGNNRISYLGANEPVPAIEDPMKSFEQALGDYAVPPDQLAEMHAQRKSILDLVAGHLDGVTPRLPSSDRYKLQQHLDHLRDLEKSLEGFTPGLCDPVGPGGGYDYKSNKDYPVTGRKQMDVVAQALSCGVTRVATIQLANSGASQITPSWPDEGISISTDSHNISHDFNQGPTETTTANRVALETWYFKQFAYFLQKLDSIDEGEGTTLLDNTLVLWCKPIGFNHEVKEMLFMLAGGAGGALETGRYLALDGKPHNDLLASCCQLMGLPDTKFGDPAYCNGPLAL